MNEKKILKKIINDCVDGYGVFEIEELNSVVPKLTTKQLKSVLKHLEVNGFINIKYSDDKAYCLAPLQKAKQVFEKGKIKVWQKYLLFFLVCFFGSFIGTIFAGIIF